MVMSVGPNCFLLFPPLLQPQLLYSLFELPPVPLILPTGPSSSHRGHSIIASRAAGLDGVKGRTGKGELEHRWKRERHFAEPRQGHRQVMKVFCMHCGDCMVELCLRAALCHAAKGARNLNLVKVIQHVSYGQGPRVKIKSAALRSITVF